MSEDKLKELQKENERLKKRVKHLEKRLSKARQAHEHNEELQEEIETLEALRKPKKEPKRAQHEICPVCNGTLTRMDAGPNVLIICGRAECKYRKTIKKRDW